MLITISGLPGAGTSTVAARVAAQLGLERFDGGSVWRAMAVERGLTVSEFSSLSEEDPSIDLELDARLAARAHDGDVVLESRLAAWIARNEGLPARKVWIECDPDERARRVGRRDSLGPEAARAANDVREASERQRYLDYYAIDISDLSVYDVVVDSGRSSPDELTDAILAATGPP